MIESIAMTGLTWMFLIGFLILTAYIVSDNNDFKNSKAYKDLEETTRNRNEDI